MTIEEIELKAAQIRHLRWLEDIAESYKKAAEYMEKNNDFFTITGIRYQCCGDERMININPHQSIANIPVWSALLGAEQGIRDEIAKLKADIEK